MSAIVMNSLSKKFGRDYALDQINLEIFNGEFFSILGLPESGKSTLVKLLFNFLKPNEGTATIFDMDVVKESKSVKDFSSVVTQDVWIYENMKPSTIFQKTLNFHETKNKEDLFELKEYFDFNEKKKYGDLDLNKKKVVSFINALMVKPKLIVLDEPTEGLDQYTADKLFLKLKALQETEGLTILLLTKSLSLAQRYSDRVGYLHNAKIQNIEALKDKVGKDKILRIFEETTPLEEFLDIGAKVIRAENNVTNLYYDGELNLLSKKIMEANLTNYNLEDATLQDKMNAYFIGGEE